jgi:hypothetical protein
VLGGIIQKQSLQVMRKTPILGSIPGLGWAFKKKDKSTQEVELTVFLHPTVLHTVDDAIQLERDFERKNPLIQKWQHDSEKIQTKGHVYSRNGNLPQRLEPTIYPVALVTRPFMEYGWNRPCLGQAYRFSHGRFERDPVTEQCLA